MLFQEINKIKEKLFDGLNSYGEKCKVFIHSKDAMKFISEVYNDTPIIQEFPGSYKLETIIENACFLGIYEVPRDYMEEQLKLYYDDNQFHIPEKIVFKLYIIQYLGRESVFQALCFYIFEFQVFLK